LSQSDTVEVISTRAAFDALESEWNALFERSCAGAHLFQSFQWCSHWLDHYLPQPGSNGTSLAVTVVRHEGRAVLIWPLLTTRQAGLTQLSFIGAPVSQYGDILLDTTPVARALIQPSWSAIVRILRPDVARFCKVRDDARMARFLADLGALETAYEEAPYADLAKAGSMDVFMQRFSSKALKNQRRKARRLDELGGLHFERHDATTPAADARAAIRSTLALKRAWLQAKGLLSRAFADRRFDAFFSAAVATPDRAAGVAVSTLRAGGEIADQQIMIDCKDRRALHVIAYNGKFERIGPGDVHIHHTIADAFARGLATVDFLAPRHEYKMEWADGVVPVRDRAVGLSPLGRLYARIYLAGVREAAKRTLSHLPKRLRGTLASVHCIGRAARPA
jgi:CelD/BcsL family acetyltransferase involved in cellulose biosynthesis